jgi:hypothetical protein
MERPFVILDTRKEIDLSVEPQFVGFSAIDSNTYDCSYEGEDENGYHWKASPAGYGATEAEAIEDLLDQLEAA